MPPWRRRCQQWLCQQLRRVLRRRSDQWLVDLYRLQQWRVWWWLWRLRHAHRIRLVGFGLLWWLLSRAVAFVFDRDCSVPRPPRDDPPG